MSDEGASPEILAQGIPFEEAIDYLRGKVPIPTRAYTDVWGAMHARAFVVAGAVKAELVADFHSAVTKAIAEGKSLGEFRKDFDDIVARHGWSYNGSRGWRSAVIYNTNLRMAQSAGRWAQAQRLAEIAQRRGETVYLRYVAVLDSRTRTLHREWHDIILPIDHAFWDSHHPPNGWNCRCTIQVLTRRALERRGLKPTEDKDLPPPRMVPARVRSADVDQTVLTPRGIDAGFGYNPGRAGFGRGADLKAMQSHGGFDALSSPFGDRPADPPMPPAKKPDVKLAPRVTEIEEARRIFREAIGGDEAVFEDPLGGHVMLSQAIVDHFADRPHDLSARTQFFPLLPGLIEDPSEIWVGFATNRITGQVFIRRRYLRVIELPNNKSLAIVADQDGGRWAGLTTFIGGATKAPRVRTGLRIFAK